MAGDDRDVGQRPENGVRGHGKGSHCQGQQDKVRERKTRTSNPHWIRRGKRPKKDMMPLLGEFQKRQIYKDREQVGECLGRVVGVGAPENFLG